MVIKDIIWTQKNIAHIAKHKVSVEEVEEVILYNPFILKTKENKYIALGQTLGGRYLIVIIAKKKKNKVKVITARDMDSKEKKFYKKIMKR